MPGSSFDLAAFLPRLAAFEHLAIVRDGHRFVVAAEPSEVVAASGSDAFDRLDTLSPGWWAGFFAYDLGRSVEAVIPRATDDTSVPDLLLTRFDRRLVIDPLAATITLEGHGPSGSALDRLVDGDGGGDRLAEPRLGAPSSSLQREEFEHRVRTIIGLIEAGECYQVNLTRRLTWDVAVDPLSLFDALLAHNPAPHAALLRAGDVAVVSASPERFLRWRDCAVETRPIKGTSADAAWLCASAKDRAENVMIVDLARNDLGRVCIPGSIEVPTLCALETHPGLHHLVSTVRGRLRDGVGCGALLRATFPPASVTGAPKPRVLQAIEDLEPVRRGVYCGAVGWLDTDRGEGDLAVAIRTFTVASGATHLGVGAGIVADSDPSAEWAETELKAARLLAAAGVAPALAGATR